MERRPDPGQSPGGALHSPFGSLGSMDGESVDICIVGAGFAGLHLARLLDGSGLDCLLLDKGRSPGGRAATRRIGDARVDHGLPWLTAGGDLSRHLIDEFRGDGLVEPLDAGGSAGVAWASPAGLSSLMKHLASARDIRLSSRVLSVSPEGDAVRLEIEDGEGPRQELTARHVVITAPVPQMVEMSPELAEAAGEGAAEAYDKAIVGLFRLVDDRGLPDRCLAERPADGISRVILESAKFPGRPPSASVRCDSSASDFLWEKTDDEIWDWMAERLGSDPPFGTPMAERQVKRWRLSEAARPVDAPFLAVSAGSSTISACGDGFAAGGPTGVENALRSAQTLFDSEPWRA